MPAKSHVSGSSCRRAEEGVQRTDGAVARFVVRFDDELRLLIKDEFAERSDDEMFVQRLFGVHIRDRRFERHIEAGELRRRFRC